MIRVRQYPRHPWKEALFAISALLLVSALTACGGDDPSSPPPPPPPSNGILTGRVIASDGSSGGILGAIIEVGTVQTTSGADGSYSLSVQASDRAVVRVEADGFAESFRIARVTAGQSTSLTIQLVPVGITENVDVGSGGTVILQASGALVVIPANGLLPRTGGTPAANVQVSVTPINVATRTSDMPGDFTATSGGGIAQLQSFGAMLIDVRDSNNVRYGLAPGSRSTIRIPVSTRAGSVPDTIPLFYFDESTGRWIQEGQATRVTNGSNSYYEGTVSRLRYWNADLVMETIIVTGCVRNAAGQPVANALVESDGIDYSGSSQAYTTTDGSFQIPIRKAGRATIIARAGTQLTNTATAGPAVSNIALDPCLVTTTPTGGFNIKLTWGASPSDLDSHLFTPNAGHVYYRTPGSLTEFPFAKLDVDDRVSFGPEVVTITRLMQGAYVYAVRNFTGTFDPGITESPGHVELTRDESTSVFVPPSGEGTKRWWHVFNIVVDAQCNVSVTPVNAWLDDPGPASSPAGTPALCD